MDKNNDNLIYFLTKGDTNPSINFDLKSIMNK